jgi:hypothetical protein
MQMSKNETVNMMGDVSPKQLEEIRALSQNLKSYSQELPLHSLFARPERNIRFETGKEVIKGLVFRGDTYALDTLIMQIVELGYIRDPLHVSKKLVNGETRYEVLRGFRRYFAARRIEEIGTNRNVIDTFGRIPCIVYENLTPEQEDALINDQTSKKFASSEVLRQVWKKLENGIPWQVIGLELAEQIATATGGYSQLQKVNNAKTMAEKNKELHTWLNSTLNQFWQGVFLHGGPQCKKWLLLTFMEKDGLLSETDEKPKIRMTSNKWTNKDQGLFAAIKKDREAGTWDAKAGTGPAFEEAVAYWVKKDSEPKGGNKTVKVKDGSTIQGMMNADGRTEPLRLALAATLVESPPTDLSLWDAQIDNWLRKREAFAKLRGELPADVREYLSLAFDLTASVDDFESRIAAFAVAKAKADAEAEAEADAEAKAKADAEAEAEAKAKPVRKGNKRS